jgi:hypothetical protein
MSWMRLLKASPTFSGMTQLKHRYRAKQMNLIPKFGNEGGKFVAPPTGRRLPAAPAPGNVLTPVGRGGATAVAAPVVSAAPPAPVATRGAARLWQAFAALGAVFSLKPQPRGVRLAPMPARRLLQPELRLDAVKPVRNDLTDCDFEVREIRLAVPAARATGLSARADGVLARAKELLR